MCAYSEFLISSMPHCIYADEFTSSCAKLLVLTDLISGPLIYCKRKDAREDEQMLAQTADKLLSKIHLECDAVFNNLQDPNNSLLGTIYSKRH